MKKKLVKILIILFTIILLTVIVGIIINDTIFSKKIIIKNINLYNNNFSISEIRKKIPNSEIYNFCNNRNLTNFIYKSKINLLKNNYDNNSLTIIEYVDYNSKFSKKFNKKLFKKIKNKFQNKINYQINFYSIENYNYNLIEKYKFIQCSNLVLNNRDDKLEILNKINSDLFSNIILTKNNINLLIFKYNLSLNKMNLCFNNSIIVDKICSDFEMGKNNHIKVIPTLFFVKDYKENKIEGIKPFLLLEKEIEYYQSHN